MSVVDWFYDNFKEECNSHDSMVDETKEKDRKRYNLSSRIDDDWKLITQEGHDQKTTVAVVSVLLYDNINLRWEGLFEPYRAFTTTAEPLSAFFYCNTPIICEKSYGIPFITWLSRISSRSFYRFKKILFNLTRGHFQIGISLQRVPRWLWSKRWNFTKTFRRFISKILFYSDMLTKVFKITP